MRIFFQANRVENGSRFKFEDKVLQLSFQFHIGKFSFSNFIYIITSVRIVYHFQDRYSLFIRYRFFLAYFWEFRELKMKFLIDL